MVCHRLWGLCWCWGGGSWDLVGARTLRHTGSMHGQVMQVIAGSGLSDKQLLQAFNEVDADGNGKVDYEEFLAGQTQLRKWKQKKKPSKHRKSTTAGGEHRHSASPAKDPALRDGQR